MSIVIALLGKRELVASFYMVCGLCAVCLGLFALPPDVIVRRWSVIFCFHFFFFFFDLTFSILLFTAAGVNCHVAVVRSLPVLHHSVICIFCISLPEPKAQDELL